MPSATRKNAFARLCELNVQTQVANVCHTTICSGGHGPGGQELSVHGWVYSLRDGLLQDLNCSVSSSAQIAEAYRVNS